MHCGFCKDKQCLRSPSLFEVQECKIVGVAIVLLLINIKLHHRSKRAHGEQENGLKE